MSPSTESCEIAVVGAGLVGSLLALTLARRGHRVEVFERRPDMRRESISAGRSINLAISTRGLHALALVDLERKVLDRAIPMRGRLIHPTQGSLSLQPYGTDETQHINSISRGELNRLLMDEAEASGRVRLHFGEKLVDGNLDEGELVFEKEGATSRRRVRAETIFGADGAHSALRGLMVARGACQAREDFLDYGYKELVIPPKDGGGYRIEVNALHIWPRGTYMLIALPNLDGSFTCTLFLPFKGALSFESLSTSAAVQRFFGGQFPDAVPLMPTLLSDFFENPTGHMVTVSASPWEISGRVLLVGDAAHAIVPFFGQGMNCGFEDCSVLAESLEDGGALREVIARFTRLRKSNADAIARMALENFIEMRDRVADPRFLLRKEVEKRLQGLFPNEYRTRYQMVTFSRMPYRRAFEIGEVQTEILEECIAEKCRIEDVDLNRAGALVRERLIPLMES